MIKSRPGDIVVYDGNTGIILGVVLEIEDGDGKQPYRRKVAILFNKGRFGRSHGTGKVIWWYTDLLELYKDWKERCQKLIR